VGPNVLGQGENLDELGLHGNAFGLPVASCASPARMIFAVPFTSLLASRKTRKTAKNKTAMIRLQKQAGYRQ
jgi:hypothetical protein